MRKELAMPQGITAVVLNYRTPAKTLACLRSLSAEGIARIVLVENSEDQGAAMEAMRPELCVLKAMGVSVQVVDEGRNLGFAAGVNRALVYIQDQWLGPVLLINSDASLERGSLSHLLDAIDEGADIAAPLIAVPGHTARSPRSYYHKYLALLTPWPLWGSFAYITGACMLLSPQIVHPNLFDEDFFFYGEDVMLGSAMARQGRVCKVVQNSVVLHEGSGSSRNGSFFYEYHIARGHWLLGRKLMDGDAAYRFGLLARTLVLFIRAMIRCARFGCLLPFKALWISAADVFRGRCGHFGVN